MAKGAKNTVWHSAGKGIRYKEHPTRRYGNHPDRYYSLFYKVNGKSYTEALGWESENREPGRSMLKRAEDLMALIRQNRRTGEAPVIKKERKELEELKVAEDRRQLLQKQAKDITLDEFFENYFAPFIKRKLAKETYLHEVGHYKNWIHDILGNCQIQNITLMSWELLLTRIFDANLATRTQIYICGTLCRILKYARDLDYNVYIPTMKKIGLVQADNRRLRIITQQELNEIFENIQKQNIYAYRLCYFSFCTGCRFSEAASLKWEDVQNKMVTFRNTKNKTSRIIPIPQTIQDMFAQMEQNLGSYVFLQRNGKPYREPPSTFKLVVDNLHLNDGCDERNKITFHSLRHTAATYMAKYLDVRSLMDIFGWKSITMAARYLHGNEEQKQKAMNSLSRYLEQDSQARIIQFPVASGA